MRVPATDSYKNHKNKTMICKIYRLYVCVNSYIIRINVLPLMFWKKKTPKHCVLWDTRKQRVSTSVVEKQHFCVWMFVSLLLLFFRCREHGRLFRSADTRSRTCRRRGGHTRRRTLGKPRGVSLTGPSGCAGNGELPLLAIFGKQNEIQVLLSVLILD